MCKDCLVVIPDLGKKENYYQVGGIEVIDIIKAKLTKEQYVGYLLGNTIKYSTRLNWKSDSAKDAKKLAEYSEWLEVELNGTPTT